MYQAVGIGTDSSPQPISLIAGSNHGFVGGNVIRISTVCRL
jgi:hypothetical protein